MDYTGVVGYLLDAGETRAPLIWSIQMTQYLFHISFMSTDFPRAPYTATFYNPCPVASGHLSRLFLQDPVLYLAFPSNPILPSL